MILTFIIIIFVISFIAVFIRAVKTERYNQVLILLEERNKFSLSNYTFENCRLGGMFKDEEYCEINGTMLYKPEKGVSYQSLFKNFGTVELTMNIIRVILTGIFLVYLYLLFNKFKRYIEGDLDNTEGDQEKAKFTNSLTTTIIFLSVLIFISCIYILIRALALTANMDIGLYEEGRQNQFESQIAINYIIDITNIILLSIAIGFVLRIKIYINKKPVQPSSVQPAIVQPVVVQPEPEPIPSNQVVMRRITVHQQISVSPVHPMDNFYNN